jgi:hypothetical protein
MDEDFSFFLSEAVCYSDPMFQIAKQATGDRGSFVRLVKLESEDYTVIVRLLEDGRLHHRYMGPDLGAAEEIFSREASKLTVPGKDR